MKPYLLLLCLVISLFSVAQMRKSKGDVFPLDRELRNGGLLIAPGITYTIPGKSTEGQFTLADTTINYTADPSGQLGGFIHLGWFHSFEDPKLIHFLDFGLSYKLFKGKEDYSSTLAINQISQQTIDSENSFTDHNLGLFFNATHVFHFAENSFLSNSLGINADYILIENRDRSSAYPIINESFQNKTTAQLHYKFGVGFRVSKKLLVVPSIETPILTLFDWDDGKSTLTYFNSRYRPILFSLQFYFLRDDPINCNAPTYNGPITQ